ncbi:MAG: redox-regulated ATPase YchF, partial [Anaeroplasmataceae bacterium]
LSNIRMCDAIIEVVRCFKDENITHVEGSVDPIRDAIIINLELILSDLEQVDKRIEKIQKKAKANVDDTKEELEVLLKIKKHLLSEQPIRTLEFSKEELKFIDNFGFLSSKPILYVCNIKEEEISNPNSNQLYKDFAEYAKKENVKTIPISAQIESELAMLDDESKSMFLEELHMEESGLDLLIRETFDLLGLATYFTCGEKEVRAWTFKKGMTAPQCAGVIHTDFERGFIRAETTAYNDLVTFGNLLKAKEAGKVRQEGKEYIVKDGDVMLFKFNV